MPSARPAPLIAIGLAAAIGLSIAFAPRGRERPVGVDLPRYPGAQYVPREPQRDLPSGVVWRGELHTPDAYQSVARFYVETLGAQPGWRGPKWQSQEMLWTDGNLRLHGRHFAAVLDPTRPGALVHIMDAGSRTVVKLFEYELTPEPAE